jgi:Domain of unknown function (DUF4118)
MSSGSFSESLMRIKNSKSWVSYSFSHALLGSVMLLLAAFIIRAVLNPYIQPYAPFHFFIVSCLLIAYFYGYKPALLGVMVSALIGNFFFVKPYGDFGAVSLSDVIQFLTFSAVALLAIFFIEQLQRTVYALNTSVKIMASRQNISLQRENDRLYFAKKQSQSWAILEEILTDFDELLCLQYGAKNLQFEPLFLKLSHSTQHFFVGDEWLELIHPDDAPTLLAALDFVSTDTVKKVTLRFSQDPLARQHAVLVESYAFMNQTLKVVRLEKKLLDV